MSKSTTFLNYTAFLILYIIGFIVLNVKNTEIIGFYFLFIINTACTLYNISYYSGLKDLYLISTTLWGSIIISGILHTVALILIIMMLSNIKIKYSDTFGTPINLPPIYRDKLNEFKKLTITTFSICSFLLIMFMISFDSINISFKDDMNTVNGILLNFFPFCILLLSFGPLIISSMQVTIANSFIILSKQQLMR
jgi:hypothetical protein